MALLDELVEEVLLRFPPAEPASLVRAALVCKPWCRVISGRRFRRRFRGFHCSPPMLGFICSMFDDNDDEDCVSRFVPTSSFCPLHADHGGRVLDARHGRVLLLTYTEGEGETDFLLVVWDPTTDERWELPTAPVGPSNNDVFRWNATVLCAATASGACNHLDCQGGPFMVVSVGITTNQVSALCVYSSQAGAWSERTLVPKCYVDERPTALVGNTLYFSIEFGDMVLAYDLATRETSIIRLPLPHEHYEYATALMTMKDGGLGIARLNKAGRLYLWSMEANPNRDGRMVWTQTRVIELEKLLPITARSIYVGFLGFAHDVGVFFMGTSDGLFTYDLKSRRVRKVCEEVCADDGIYGVVPYMSFYTPALGAVSTVDGSRGASRACPRGSSE